MMRAVIPATLGIHFLSSLTPLLIILGWLGALILMGSDGLTYTWTEQAVFILHLLLLFVVPVCLCSVSLRFVWNRNPMGAGWLSGRKKWLISFSTLWPLIAMLAGWAYCTMILRDEGFAMLALAAFLPYALLGTLVVYLVFLRPLGRVS